MLTYATEALDFGQTLNVQRDVPAEIAPQRCFVNAVTDLSFIVSRQILTRIRVDSSAMRIVSSALTDTINIKSDQPRSIAEADQHQQYVPPKHLH